MKLWKPIAGLVVLGIAVGSWLRTQTPDATRRASDQPEHADSLAGAEPRQTPPPAERDSADSPSPPTEDKASPDGPLNQFLNAAGLDHIKAVLDRPGILYGKDLPHPRAIPLLDAASEGELLRRFHAPGSVTNKVMVIHLLGCGGSLAAVAAFAGALTNDYGGRLLTHAEDRVLGGVLNDMSFLARRHAEAATFLRQACTPEFWRAARLWESTSIPKKNLIWMLVGTTVKAFQWSERPEAAEVIEHYRNNPAAMSGGTVATGAMPDADYIRALIAAYGFDRAWELRSRGLTSGQSIFGDLPGWYRTEGLRWMEWEAEVAAETAKQRTQSVPER